MGKVSIGENLFIFIHEQCINLFSPNSWMWSRKPPEFLVQFWLLNFNFEQCLSKRLLQRTCIKVIWILTMCGFPDSASPPNFYPSILTPLVDLICNNYCSICLMVIFYFSLSLYIYHLELFCKEEFILFFNFINMDLWIFILYSVG